MPTTTESAPSAVMERLHRSALRTRELFGNECDRLPPSDEPSQRLRIASKMAAEYDAVKDMAPPAIPPTPAATATDGADGAPDSAERSEPNGTVSRAVDDAVAHVAKRRRTDAPVSASASSAAAGAGGAGGALVTYNAAMAGKDQLQLVARGGNGSSQALVASRRRAPPPVPTPEWHAPWKLKTVISGHLGWVRAVAVEPGNEWFVTGAADRTVKIWDLATGQLRLTLTGHINCIRGLAVSPRHPYLFTAGEDKKVMCWDLETNKVVRHYHGHLSGVYSLALHPTLDVLMTGGRDSVCRVWDMRSKQQIHCLGGHKNTVVALGVQATDPQVITGSMDSTVRLWDLAAGKTMATLTHHKKAVRALCLHPTEWSFVTAGADNIKKWHGKDGAFIKNFVGHNAILNAACVNQDGVLFTGGDNGSMRFWDYGTGHCFQHDTTRPQPGSLDSENGIMTACFDRTGTRLITGEADKTIKIWKEDEDASAETHPIDMKAWSKICRSLRRF